MNEERLVERLFQALISGDRETARTITREATDADGGGLTPEELSQRVYWDSLEMLNSLFRSDKLTTLAHHYGIRLLRSLIDQAQAGYTQNDRRNCRVLLFSGTSEADELAGQLVTDLIEADGYDVNFAGGGIANDEILSEVGERKPDILLMFASAPSDAPNIRLLIDHIRSIGACPDMQIVVGGGVFNRAEGLAQEIGADLWAKSPCELLEKLNTQRNRRATDEQRTVGRNRRPARKAA